MKKSAITIAAILISFGFTSTNKNGISSKQPINLQTKISKSINYPEFALKSKIVCSVFVIIRIEKNGEIFIVKCGSREPKMANYVSNQLKSLIIDDYYFENDKEYLIKIDFNMNN